MKDTRYLYVRNIYLCFTTHIWMTPLLSNFIGMELFRYADLIFISLILYYFYRLYVNDWLEKYSKMTNIIFLLLETENITMFVRGNWDSDISLNIVKFSLNCMLYIAPLILLYLPNYDYQKKILKIFYYTSLISIPLWILNYGNLVFPDENRNWAGEAIGAYLPFFSAFLLGLSYSFLSKKEKKINIIIYLVFLILMILNARRNVSFSLFLYGSIAYIYKYRFIKKNNSAFINFIITISLILIITVNFDILTLGPFETMYNRSMEDSRDIVTEYFLNDFGRSPWTEWLLGRGYDGTYVQFFGGINEEFDRSCIETGYLDMILKGGLIYDVLFVLIVLIALRQAFKTNYSDSYYMGIILCSYLLDNYTTSPITVYSVRVIIFYFIVSVLLSETRKKSFIWK